MAMRDDCKNYQTRSYAGGEAARFCVLDLAPEAPWKCPTDCLKYERRVGGVGFTWGSLADTANQPNDDVHVPDGAASLLDQAEDIINAAVPAALIDKRNAEAQPKRLTERIRKLWRR